MSGEIFRLAADMAAAHASAAELFAIVLSVIGPRMPPTASILHIGATAIAGCLTKGDLDIVVRVMPEDFTAADVALGDLFARNDGSIRTAAFAAFSDESSTPPLGIQLTAIGGAFDDFHVFAERMAARPDLVARYNSLKRIHDGQPMSDYREAKARFITEILAAD